MKFCSDESYAAAEKHEPIGLEHLLEQLKKATDRERDKEKMREGRGKETSRILNLNLLKNLLDDQECVRTQMMMITNKFNILIH